MRQDDEAGAGYYFMNPIAWSLMAFVEFDIRIPSQPFVFFLSIATYLSPAYPSLLFYLGMVLRRRIVRQKQRNWHLEN